MNGPQSLAACLKRALLQHFPARVTIQATPPHIVQARTLLAYAEPSKDNKMRRRRQWWKTRR